MKTVIVGAGPAGLAGAFWRLRRDPAAEVVVLEAAPRVGGWVQTECHEGYRCEVGPQAVRPSAELDALVEALGLGDQLVPAAPAAKSRWIGRGGRLLAAPAGPLQLLRTPLLSMRGKLRLLKEPFVRGGDPTGESLSSFVCRRFGDETGPLVQAMISGIFAGDADQLEAESVFPLLASTERDRGSVIKGMMARRKRARAAGERKQPRRHAAALYSLTGGMSDLVQAVARELGDRVRTGCPVQAVRRIGSEYHLELPNGETLTADEVVLACPASSSARLVGELDRELATELGSIPFASVASVYLGFPDTALPPQLRGFGFLLEAEEKTPVLGAIYVGSLFPDHAPAGHTLVRVMIGGRRHPDAIDRSDSSLIDLAVTTLMRYSNCRIDPSFRHVVRAKAGIAQYEFGHTARLARIEQRLATLPGLSLRGNSYRAVALSGQLGQTSGTDDAAGGDRAPVAGAVQAR